MVSLQRRIEAIGEARERRFFEHALQYLQTSSGYVFQVKGWMIAPLDVEFGPSIGTGGL
jgi:hypothetical protein